MACVRWRMRGEPPAFAGFDAPVGGRPEEVLDRPNSTPRIVTKTFRL